MTPKSICELLLANRFRVGTEAALQIDIAGVLTGAGVAFEREARLAPGERIDFLIEGGIGIEAKTRAVRRHVFRQLTRYAEIDAISSLILFTGTSMGLPAAINGKPVFLVSIGRTFL